MGLLHKVEHRFVPLLGQDICGPMWKGMGRESRSLLWCFWLRWEATGSMAGKGSGS